MKRCVRMTASTVLPGVLLDMDGVLCDSEPWIAQAAASMFRERHNCRVQAQDFHPFVGTGENRFLGGVAEKYGVALRLPEDKEYTYDVYLSLIPGRLKPLPGVHSFLADCRSRGLHLALASSADRRKVDGNLAAIGLAPTDFDAVISGDCVQNKKPYPEIFERAARSLGLDPRCCLVVEDAPSGIQAGCAAGCRCLGLTSSFSAEALRAEGALWTAPNLAAVPPVVFERKQYADL